MSEHCNFSGRNPQNDYQCDDDSRSEILRGSTYRENSPPEYVPNDTFFISHVSPEMYVEEENVPACCQSQDPPIYRKLKDPTITYAPNRTRLLPESESRCHCKAGEYADRPRLDITQRVPMPSRNLTYQGGQQLPIQRVTSQPRDITQTSSTPFNPTRNVIRAVQHMQSRQNDTVSRPLGFDHLMQAIPSSNRTYNLPSPTQTTMGSEDYTDLGPWRNFDIPRRPKKINIAPNAYKTYPRMSVPAPSRNYSTYGDPQPILDVKEVAEHRKKAPRFYSTPTSYGFKDQGTSQSTVWGRDAYSPTLTDSSGGWSQGVRMDSFNVFGEITPSPRNIKVPPRANITQMPPITNPNRIPAPHKTYTHLQNPYPRINLPPGLLYSPAAESSRIRNETVHLDNRTQRRTQPVPTEPNKTYVAEDKAFCSPCTPNETCSSEPVEPATSETDEKGKEKDFCTVLEIRTPCAENPCMPEKPLQLSINVTCADPSMLVAPDKRFHVTHQAPARPPRPPQTQNRMNDTPSDCECN